MNKALPFHLLLLLAPAANLLALAAPVIPTVEQELVVVGDPVQVTIEPVYAGKAWAFTARWDDNHKNNPNMRDALADVGLKGTFYLNRSTEQAGMGPDYARSLTERGCSVGGHTTWHYALPTLNPNTLFCEILLNRIEREAEIDTPITSFAFPYGRYSDNTETAAIERITETWLRSGYHHNVYYGFVYENPSMPEGYASSVHQVRPGDSKINAGSFKKQVDELLAAPEKAQQDDPVISLGVHTRQSPREMEKFKALMSEYAGREDFWYCNETELAAYRLQAKHTQSIPEPDSPNTWHIVRPRASYAGANVPLTLHLSSPTKPDKILLDGQELTPSPNGHDGWLVNLPYSPVNGAPEKITWMQNGPGEHHATPANDFPGLDFRLEPSEDGDWSLILSNHSDTAAQDILVTLRLPLYYADGIRQTKVNALHPGDSTVLHFDRGTVRDDPIYRDGALFAAAEIDFQYTGHPGRIYSSYLGEPVIRIAEDVRDAAVVVGPLPPDFPIEELLAYSRPNAPFTPVTDSPLGQWRTVNDAVRAKFASNRFVLFNPDKAWVKASGPYDGQPALIGIVCDVKLEQSGPLKIEADQSLTAVGVDGEELSAQDGVTSPLPPGKHRLLLVMKKYDRGGHSKPRPVHLRLSVNGHAVKFLPAAAR
ncbi:MAG: polysaccharide deacetylase family protein [Verrucomicrobiota bacterium JB024]|nr:polysaccharide deacetylase family protein [Verrucomicrobiota bacterium JB024]